MKKRSIIASSIVMIMLCFSIIAGATFALFTDTAQNDIVASSGKVDYSATVSNLKIWSIEETGVGNPIDVKVYDPMVGERNFYYNERTTLGNFTPTGTATIGEDYKLTLERMVPGDKVQVTVNIANASNVDTKFRIKIIAMTSEEGDLADVLDVWTDTVTGIINQNTEHKTVYSTTTFKQVDDEVTGNPTDVVDVRTSHLRDTITDLDCFASEWYQVATGSNPTFNVTVLLPAQVRNLYQDKSVTLTFRVEAVQVNGANNH